MSDPIENAKKKTYIPQTYPPQSFPLVFGAIENGAGVGEVEQPTDKKIFFCEGNYSKTIRDRKIKLCKVIIHSLIFKMYPILFSYLT